MSIILGTLQQGLLFGLLAVGIYISFRILNIPDLTTEGSFTFGLAVSAMITINGHPFLAILAGAASGFLAGVITGLLQTKCRIHPVLAGILTMSGLYSINMWVMGEKANVTLISTPQQPVNTIFSFIEEKLGITSSDISELVIIAVITAAVCALLILFFKTQTGLSIRAAGNNDTMVRA
ncbi:MAG: ABC transporter permease, partial [Porcipelethomonas sp.]